MRDFSPSTTLTLTSTVSPGWKSGMSLLAVSFATCSCSSCWIRFMGNLRRQRQGHKAGLGALMFFGLSGSGELLRQRLPLVTLLEGGLKVREGRAGEGLFGQEYAHDPNRLPAGI